MNIDGDMVLQEENKMTEDFRVRRIGNDFEIRPIEDEGREQERYQIKPQEEPQNPKYGDRR